MRMIGYIILVGLLLFVISPGKSTPKGALIPITEFSHLGVNNISISLMEQAMKQAKIDFQGILNRTEVRSILIPSDEAFINFLAHVGDDFNRMEDFDEPGELDVLKEIVNYHMLLDELRLETADYTLKTLQGEPMIGLTGEEKRVTNDGEQYANVVQDIVKIGHLSVFVIDKVLLPPSY